MDGRSGPLRSVGFAVKHMVVSTFRGTLRATINAGSSSTRTARCASTAASGPTRSSSRTRTWPPTSRRRLLRRRAATRRSRFASRSSATSDGELTVDGELTIKGNTPPAPRHRHDHRPRGPFGDTPRSASSSRPRRSHGVRPELERAAAQGRLRARRRRHAARSSSSSPRRTMRVLGLSGSPALGLAQLPAPPGGRLSCCRPEAELEVLRRPEGDPALRRRRRRHDRAARGARAARGGRRRPTPCSSPRRSTTARSRAQLKNALDWLSRPHAENPLRGKPAAVVGAATGMFGAVWAQAEARKVLRHDRRPRARSRAAGRLADERHVAGDRRPRPRARAHRHRGRARQPHQRRSHRRRDDAGASRAVAATAVLVLTTAAASPSSSRGAGSGARARDPRASAAWRSAARAGRARAASPSHAGARAAPR